MENILERVKARIAQPNSPIRTVRAVAEAIDMSESGFYRMIERKTYKKSTLLALSKALDVKEAYFLTDTDESKEKIEHVEQASLERIVDELKILREQLSVKDRQLEAKDYQINQLLNLLGKLEGAIIEPLSTETTQFEMMMYLYQKASIDKLIQVPPFYLAQPVAK